ncbi:Uncharacterised protein g5319 [Pycnogonum litorale]
MTVQVKMQTFVIVFALNLFDYSCSENVIQSTIDITTPKLIPNAQNEKMGTRNYESTTRIQCSLQCLKDPYCAQSMYDSYYCEMHYTIIPDDHDSEFFPDRRTTRFGTKVDVISASNAQSPYSIMAGTYLEDLDVYLLIKVREDTATHVMFYNSSRFHKADQLIAIYPWEEVFPSPSEIDAWETSSDICVFQQTSGLKHQLVVCRGTNCVTYTQTTKGNFRDWDEVAYSGLSWNPATCTVRKNAEIEVTVSLQRTYDANFIQVSNASKAISDMVKDVTFLQQRMPLRQHQRRTIILHRKREYENAEFNGTVYDVIFIDGQMNRGHAYFIDFNGYTDNPYMRAWSLARALPFYIV